jgi:5-methylcytosine-specific restriction endonuclease McrA
MAKVLFDRSEIQKNKVYRRMKKAHNRSSKNKRPKPQRKTTFVCSVRRKKGKTSRLSRKEWYNNEYLKSDHWTNFKIKYFTSTQFCGTCLFCSAREELRLHHLNYSRLGREELTDVVALCDFHHQAAHRTINGHRVKLTKKALTKRIEEMKKGACPVKGIVQLKQTIC